MSTREEREEIEIAVVEAIFDEIPRAEIVHGVFETVPHGIAVAMREAREAEDSAFAKPFNRTDFVMECVHAAASFIRLATLVRLDPSYPVPGPFSSRGDDMTTPRVPE